MLLNSWELSRTVGFLTADPLVALDEIDSPLDAKTIDAIETLADGLIEHIAKGDFRPISEALPVFDFRGLRTQVVDARILERLFMLYGYFANAYVLMPPAPTNHLPQSLAIPLVELGDQLGRVPVLAYSGMVLSNWRRIDPDEPIDVDNIEILTRFTDLPDEAWFFKIHVAIEANAGEALYALYQASEAADMEHDRGVLRALRTIQETLVKITRIFNRMIEGCDPDVYYQQVRPFLFGLTDVVYEGLFDDEPQTFRGGSGAQSSIVPALLAGLGIQHARNELTSHLTLLHHYMPPEHQRFIGQMQTSRLRNFVSTRPALADVYNNTLRRLMTFRRAHLYYARTYIFEKSTNPMGTGGTHFMEFLGRLIEETESHLL